MGARGNLKLAPIGGKIVTEGTAANQAKPAAPVKPDDLSEEISKLWDELISPLDEAGLVSPMDFPTVVLALEHYALARRAANDVRDEGLKTYDEKNQREARNPAVMVFNSSTETFIKLANTLGLSIVSRARTAVDSKSKDYSDNPFM